MLSSLPASPFFCASYTPLMCSTLFLLLSLDHSNLACVAPGFFQAFWWSYRTPRKRRPLLLLIPVIRSCFFWVSPIALPCPLTLLFSVGGVVPPVLLPRVSSGFSGLFACLRKPIPPTGIFIAGPLARLRTEVACLLFSIHYNLPDKRCVSRGDNRAATGVAVPVKRQTVRGVSSYCHSSSHLSLILQGLPIALHIDGVLHPKHGSFILSAYLFL